MNESNVFVVLVHVYIKITKDVQLFHIGFQYVNVCTYNFKKVTFIRRSINNSSNQRCGFRQKSFNKNISDFLRRKVFLQVTDITSKIASDTSTVSVPITSEELIVRYLDFLLKNGFTKLKLRYSDNSSISACNYISNFINL